ncbi:GAF sensor signal transduction histidine kinase [Xylanimonas cellulosilytica DSM 15894]|uniref:GAF sensor signal transduction histidine kinase n=1 Tax=Xylanimonas cellulosilytica (strain DSM 15894 / JCM 12276 / CECT 5975 / KCTC 9989 / LMG 20990 / NBRC 107835 / XIL07) TaxID=446471 RepID=D1BUI9_XYLCX|nr:GAF domain-containing protein [Xylanimonas cellulosilytica]ACZ29230.1 GAF sensor signal transduction histidine kinase [Xylanimonas cellulosilytica DSM 15894]
MQPESRSGVDVLLEAVLAVGRGLELGTTLHRLVQAAADLTDARYAALGVLDADGRIGQFLTVGMAADEIRALDHHPTGQGILGELIRDPRPLRISDVRTDPRAAGFPARHPEMDTFLGVPLRVHDAPFGNLYLTSKRGGGDFTDADQRRVEALAAAASIAIENARLYDDARLRERWAVASDEISRRLLAGDSPDDVLDLIAQHAAQVAGADVAALSVPGEDGLVVRAAFGDRAARGTLIPPDGSFAAEVFDSGLPVVTVDAAADPRTTPAIGAAAATIGPFAALPLGDPGHTRGVLSVGRERGKLAFTDVVIEALQGFAAQAAVALELAERRRDAARLAVVRDRHRIARDLHDLAIQRLFATGLGLQGVARRLERADDADDAARVWAAVDEVDETIGLIRTTIRGLQPSGDDPRRVGVRSRAIAEVEAAARALGFPPALRFEGPVDALVPPDTADHLVAVVRESLSNVARHAHATRTDVLLTAGDELTVTVSDDGVGIAAGTTLSGLANLRTRARELGGTLTIAAGADGRGTRLRWQVPLPTSG